MSKQEKSNESQQDSQDEPQQPQVYTKSDYIKARAVISAYKEAQKTHPKRPCSEKQLAQDEFEQDDEENEEEV